MNYSTQTNVSSFVNGKITKFMSLLTENPVVYYTNLLFQCRFQWPIGWYTGIQGKHSAFHP